MAETGPDTGAWGGWFYFTMTTDRTLRDPAPAWVMLGYWMALQLAGSLVTASAGVGVWRTRRTSGASSRASA